jgi:hypothetical protein
MTKAWRVEILDSMPDADMVLARFYYNNGVAIRFKAKADGATYSGTVAVVARRFYYRVSNGRKQVMYIAQGGAGAIDPAGPYPNVGEGCATTTT